MEGVLDALSARLLTEVNDYDLCITEFVRVVDRLLPVKSVSSHLPGIASRQPARRPGTPVRIRFWASIPQWLAENATRARRRWIAWRGPELRLSVKVVNGGGGARHCKIRHLSGALSNAGAAPSHLPVTVKVRLGWDSGDRKNLKSPMRCSRPAPVNWWLWPCKAQGTAPSISTGRRSAKYASV